MSLRYTRGAFSSTRGYVCLDCRLGSCHQRLRSQHTEASHGTASEGELIPRLQNENPQNAPHVEPNRSTLDHQVPKTKLDTSGALQLKTTGQAKSNTSNPPSAEATRLQQLLQRQFAEHRRQKTSQTTPQTTVNEPRTSSAEQGQTKKRREKENAKLRASSEHKPLSSSNPAATEENAVSTKNSEKQVSGKPATSSSRSRKAKPQAEGDSSKVSPAVKEASSTTEDSNKLPALPLETQNVEALRGHSKAPRKSTRRGSTKAASRAGFRLGKLGRRKAAKSKTSSKPSSEPRRSKLYQKHLSHVPPGYPTTPADQHSKHIAPSKGETQLKHPGLKPPARTGSGEDIVIETVRATDLKLNAIKIAQPAVRSLSYGLDRVLFNPGVYHIQDPRSRVYNFDPYLQKIMPVVEFDFNALKAYITSSRDEALESIAREHGKRYVGSSSSMTGILAHFHYLLSQWRKIYTDMLSGEFPKDSGKTFTQLSCAPNAVFLRWKDGHYAIDADKEFSGANILMMLGKSMEKLLTLSKDEFEKYRKSSPEKVPQEERNAPESYHYSTMGDFLMRSQLDAHDPRLPGTGMFDLKTRAVVAVRMDAQQYEMGMDYEIKTRHGAWESYEREYFDMIRAAFLKYSLQVRMGRMDGIFVAFHNTQRIFGFQYISSEEMDMALHGQWDLTLGDNEFKLSLELLNKVLDRATKKYPEQSLRIFFEARDVQTPFMYIFAEPMTEDQIDTLQSASNSKVEEFERNILGLCNEDGEWAGMQADVEKEMEKDEIFAKAFEVEDNGSERTGLEIGSIGDQSQPHKNNSRVVKADSQDTDEDSVAVSRGAQDIQDIDEREGNGMFDLDGERQGKISRSEQDPTTSDRPALQDEGESPQHSDEAATTATTNSPEASSQGPDNVNTQANAPLPDTAGKEDPPPSSPKELLAMTLTIRNRVNGELVVRPENLSPRDRWTVEYALANVQKPEKAWALYGASQARRRKLLEDTEQDEGKTVDWYIRNLRNLSSKAKAWREQQDAKDKEKPTVVLRT